MPRFTVIVPFHNAAETIEATSQSIRAQSFADWEALFVNDRSTDQSPEIVAAHAGEDTRIRLVANAGRGPSDARNHGARLAVGEFLSFCDADDLWAATRLADLDGVFRETGADALYSRIAFFRHRPEDGRTQSTVLPRPLQIADLLAENPVCTMSNLTVGTTPYLRVGGLDAGLVHNEDLEFLIRFVGDGNRLLGVDALHVWYRTNPWGLSSDLDAMRQGRRRAIALAQRYGVVPMPQQEAVFMRYLARRALRLDSGSRDAMTYTLAGLRSDARAFLTPLRRGGLTAAAAFTAPCMPRVLRQTLFST